MGAFWQDIRYGVRAFVRQPAFTAVAVLTIALGIGANTAIFAYVDALLLRPPQVPEPERVVRLYGATESRRFDIFSHANFTDIRDRATSFTALAAHQLTSASLSTGDEAESIQVELVSGTYFQVMGARPLLGRVLQPADDVTRGAHPVMVISHGLWTRRFGSSPDILNRTVYVNSHPFTVVGVAPPEFRGTYDALQTDLWAPMMMYEQVRSRGQNIAHRGWGWLYATGRLKPGVALATAQAEIDQIAAQLAAEYPRSNDGVGFALYPAGALPEQFRDGATKVLAGFAVMVGLVLLVACANIAGMLLARVVGRRREIAVRLSLGATRGRLVRQWLTESLLLSAAAGVVSLVVALWMADALLWLRPPDSGWQEFAPSIRLDWTLLAFTFGVTVATGLFFGLTPAWQAGRTDVGAATKDESSSGWSRSRLRSTFVVAQVAVSMVVLLAGGLLLRSLRTAQSFDPGFDSDRLALARVDLRRHGYDEARGRVFWSSLVERLQSAPGVESVALANVVPLGGETERIGLLIDGHQPPPERGYFSTDFNLASENYFATMGIPLVRGRSFSAQDVQPGAPAVAVINETMARRYWSLDDAVGKSVRLAGGPRIAEVVGVVRDVKYASLGEEPRPYIYFPAGQNYSAALTVHVRAASPAAVLETIRGEIKSLDPKLALAGLMTFTEMRRLPLFPQFLMATVASAFALLALALAAVGVYGLMVYMVMQRTREFGVRMALGARPADVLRMVMKQGLVLLLLGTAVGAVAGAGAAQLMKGALVGVGPFDPQAFAAAGGLLLLVTLAACWIPARRATRVDPITALRYE